MKMITSDEDEPIDVENTIQRLQASKTLDNVKSVILKWELSSAEMQVAVSNNYGKLLSAFDNFQKSWNQQQKVSAKPKQQAILTDMIMFFKSI